MTETLDKRAQAFVSARLSAGTVKEYPGELPSALHEAYSIQDDALRLWPEPPAGWKVGRITGDYETQFGEDRLAGPVFPNVVTKFPEAAVTSPVFGEGFAAVEGEVTAVIGKDVPAGKTDFTTEDALEFIESLHLGVEVASSPFPGINDFGPLVTISDFGNNYGLILGKEIPDWREMSLADWMFETEINGETVGKATPEGLPGGPVESVRFLLENTARRGFPVKAGMMILTGAVTGVHEAHAGDTASVTLNGDKVSLKLVEA